MKNVFISKATQAENACKRGDFEKAILIYSECIKSDPENPVLLSNRSAAYVKNKQYDFALDDGKSAAGINPNWPKAHYRQGVALQHMNRHSEALAAFATAVAHDPGSQQLLQTLIEAGMKSPLQATLSPLFTQVQEMGMGNDPFINVSIIGQELLNVREVYPAITVLEAALQIGTSNTKLKGSVLSALSSAHWKTGNTKRAMRYMEDDLKSAEELEDEVGQCRAHGNLGSAYYSQNMYKKSLKHHKLQLNFAAKQQDRRLMAEALTSLGHVYVSVGDNASALASHKRCLTVCKELGDRLAEGKELGKVGSVYTLMGDHRNASQYYLESLRIAEEIKDGTEVIRSCNNLGSLFYSMREYGESITYFMKALKISAEKSDLSGQCRALGGLGHTYRGQLKLDEALRCHEKQLKIAMRLDRSSEARARSNIGIVLQQKGQFRHALDFHKSHLVICRELSDKDGEGRACGNIGNAYHSLGQYERAIKYHKYAIALCKELRDQHSEASLHGNLAVAFQALEMYDEAEAHYKKHLEMTRLLRNLPAECQAESNLGNFYIVKGNVRTATNHFVMQLSLAEKLDDVKEIAKACHSLGYSNYLKENYSESVDYYERNIRLVEKIGESVSLGTVYCNLGLAYLGMNNFKKAAEWQKKFLVAATEKKNVYNICKALGNIGDVYFKEGNFSEALRFFSEKLKVSEESRLETQKAVACNKLGRTYVSVGNYRKALEMYNKELALNKAFNETGRAFECYENLAHVHLTKKNYNEAYATHTAQLEMAKESENKTWQARARSNLGLILIQLEMYKEAKDEFRSQLDLLKSLNAEDLEFGKCHGHIGDCYFYMKDLKESLKHYQNCLDFVTKSNDVLNQDMAYKCLTTVYRAMDNLQEARVCAEKRLALSNDVEDAVKCEAYGELGDIHLSMGNVDQAMSYFQNQQKVAKDSRNIEAEINALGGLGRVHEKNGTFEKALSFHSLEYELCEKSASLEAEGKAACSLGLIYKHLGKYSEAVNFCEKALAVGNQLEDTALQSLVHTRLAMTKHLMSCTSESASHLQKVKEIAGKTKDRPELIKTYFRLGVCDFTQRKYQAAEKSFFNVINSVGDNSKEENAKIGEFILASFQMLQRTFVAEKRYADALKAAEKSRIHECKLNFKLEKLKTCESACDNLMKRLNKVNSVVLYYSIAAGQLLIWVIAPRKGIVKFTMVPLLDGYGDGDFEGADLDDVPLSLSRHVTEIFDNLIRELRESIAVGAHCSKTELRRYRSFDCEMVDILPRDQMPLKKYSRVGQRATFFTPPKRINKTTYNFAMKQKHSLTVKPIVDDDWQETVQYSALYSLLIRPVRKELNVLHSKMNEATNLLIVAPNDMQLVPFSLLKDNTTSKFLADKYKIRTAFSLVCATRGALARKEMPSEVPFRDLIVNGNEAELKEEVANMRRLLGADVIVVDDDEKNELKSKLSSANIIHFATKVSWANSSLVLSGEEVGRLLCGSPSSEPDIDSADGSSGIEYPSMPDVMLTTDDIARLDLHAKLVVFSVSHIAQPDDPIIADKLNSLINAFQLAGAEAVLISQWPLPNIVTNAFFTVFYEKFNDNFDICDAFHQAVLRIKQSEEFGHPSNWAGFMLSGLDISLHKKRASLAQILYLLLERPNRDAIKVLLHLVEKARQRIAQGKRSSMYTSQTSIKGKVGDVLGWQELLSMVGFRFEPANDGLPDSVFFPSTDHVGILNRCSNTLYAFLGLSRNGMEAMSKLRSAPEVAQSLIKLLREVIESFAEDLSNVQVPLSIKIWRVAGCHELLSSLGFDLMGVGREEVVLRSGRSNLRRPLQCALQSVIDLFEAEEGEGEFMCTVNGRAFSEVQLQRGENSLSRESVDSGMCCNYPVRKARSSPIKPVKHKSSSKNSLHASGEDLNNAFDDNNNRNHKISLSFLSLQSKVGLFAGKGSEQDVGSSARRLRIRGSNSNVARGAEERDFGSPLGFNSANRSSSLKKFQTTESLIDLHESEREAPGHSFFYQGNDNSKPRTSKFQDSTKSQALPVKNSTFPLSDSQIFPRSNAATNHHNSNSLPMGVFSKSDSFPLEDLSEDDIPNRVWKVSEDSDASLSSSTSGASKSSVKFKFDRIDDDLRKQKNGQIDDGKDYYSQSNLSLVIRNRLACNQIHKSNASIARGTTIIDALKLDKKDSVSSSEGVLPVRRSAPIRMRPPHHRPRGSISSSSTDSANVIENHRSIQIQDSPASPPSSQPSSLSSLPSSEDAARKAKETLTTFAVANRRKASSSANSSLVISRI